MNTHPVLEQARHRKSARAIPGGTSSLRETDAAPLPSRDRFRRFCQYSFPDRCYAPCYVVVAAKLQEPIARGKKHLAIFYGAGHLPGSETLLKEPHFQTKDGQWLAAWSMKRPAKK